MRGGTRLSAGAVAWADRRGVRIRAGYDTKSGVRRDLVKGDGVNRFRATAQHDPQASPDCECVEGDVSGGKTNLVGDPSAL
jgi:hypothetical protein